MPRRPRPDRRRDLTDDQREELLWGPEPCRAARCGPAHRGADVLPRIGAAPDDDPEQPWALFSVAAGGTPAEHRPVRRPCCSCFASVEARRAAWWAHREELMALLEPGHAGRRPWAYWAIERHERPADPLRRLAELGLLSAEEQGYILAQHEAAIPPSPYADAAAAIRAAREVKQVDLPT